MLAIAFPHLDPVAIQVGPLAIRWYGLAYFAGILLGWFYIRRLIADPRLWGGRPAPVSHADIDDFLLWATLGIILGGRLGYAIFYQSGHYLDDPVAFFRLWEGGMSFHGGLLGIAAAIALFARRRRIPALSLVDLVAAAGPIGLFFGRIANFINSELWGRPTDVPWGVVFPNGGPSPRHPSQIYEAALEGLLLFLLLRVLTHRFGALRRPGLVGGSFVAGYGAARIAAEFFREPDAQLGYITGFATMGMLLSLPMLLLGIGVMVWASRRRPA